MIINYKGKTLETKFYKTMSDSLFEKLKKEYFTKPTKSAVLNEVRGIFLEGNVTMKKINDYYFKDLFSQVKLYHSKWSIAEVFEYKPLLESFYAKIFENTEVYPPQDGVLKNIETAFRLGGKGVASKPTNFDLNQTIEILKKYNINNNYYDPSCGWGVRLVGSMACGLNYFGTDPNYKLTERLKELGILFQEVDLFAPTIEILTQGSEYFVEHWENKMGLIFTSPPYFFLEDYNIGDQSTKLYPEYNDWLEKYYYNTFVSCYNYAIKGANMLINIKDYDKFDLEYQTKKLASKAGWTFIGLETFENIQRTNSNGGVNENSENIFVFKKI